MRCLAWIAPGALFLTCLSASRADTRGEVDQICPLCETKFKAVLSMSGTQFGMRLDLRQVGPIASPWLVAVCPKCGFVLFKGEGKFGNEGYSQAELKAFRAVVNSPEYKRLDAKTPSYLRLARLYEGAGRPPFDVAFAYLQASWQAEDRKDDRRTDELLESSLAWIEKHLASGPAVDDSTKSAEFLKGELLRRLRRPDEAKRQFDRLKGMKPFAENPFPRLIAEEERLLRIGDRMPQEMDQGEDFPIATDATVHVRGDEAAKNPGLFGAGAVSADTVVVVADAGEGNRELFDTFGKVVGAGDRAALDRLIQQGRAFRLKEGDRVRVRVSWPRTTDWKAGLPSDPGGVRMVRVLEGEHQGRDGFIPARNLKP
ncbi:MAG: DUF2225 domain-containing protein [Isosphaeraceae bacterium]